MEKKKKMAIIGTYDTILPFKAIGMDYYVINDIESAKNVLDEVSKKNYGIIYIEEAFASKLITRINELNKENKDLSITIIPGSKGGMNFGVNHITNLVKKALGINIFQEENK